MKKTLGAVAAAAAIAISLSACGGSAPASTEAKGEINYWLWDANQLPAYQQCADDFTKANPDIKVKITQRGWDDYWTTLTNGFVAGTAPDVFTNHLSKYPEYAAKKQLLSLDEAVAKDGIKLESLQQGTPRALGGPGRQALRTAQGLGHRGPLLQQGHDRLRGPDRRADGQPGLEPAGRRQLREGNRAPDRGQERRARRRGRLRQEQRRRLRPRPGRQRLRQGQTEWSFLSATTGWTATDKNPWGTKFNYDDPSFQETIAWWAGLVEKGYMPKLETTVGASLADNFGAGKAAINTTGDWLIGQYKSYKGVKTAFAPTPKGPEGKRASPCSTAWPTPSGPAPRTRPPRSSGSNTSPPTACQDVVASKGVVFPAITSSSEKAAEAFKAKGTDVSAFTTHVKEGHHVPVPDRG